MAKATFDLEENVACVLCYALGWLTGLIVFLVEKENKTVRFHAMQSIITFLGITIVLFIINALSWFIPFIWILSGLIGLLALILWLILIIKAYRGEKFKLPIIGDIAEKNS